LRGVRAYKTSRLRTEDNDGDLDRTEDTKLVGFLEQAVLALRKEKTAM
jgi:hypothetical protein